MRPLDLVYVLGTGSRWRNNEIRYSLRSVERHLPHARVFVVGYLPKFMRNVIHLDCSDPTQNKLQNSIHKTLRAASDPRVGERFVLMNDDFFFLKPVKKMMVFHRGTMSETIARHPTKAGYYYDAMRRTRQMLVDSGIRNPKDYAVHFPMVLEKSKVREVARKFDYRSQGFLFRTAYANLNGMGGYFRNDVKPKTMADLALRKFRDIELLSSSDAMAVQPSFHAWLERKFPEPSRYEIRDVEDDCNDGKFKVLYHTPRKFSYGSRSWQPGEVVEGPMPKKLVKEAGLTPIWGGFGDVGSE